MIPSNLYENLEQTFRLFSKYLTDKNFHQNEGVISWLNYKSGISKLLYVKEYENIVNKRQYSFKIKENNGFENQNILGIVQIYYEFNAKGLVKSKLAYYPIPKLLNIEEGEIESYIDINTEEKIKEIYDILSELVGFEFKITNTTSIRFDFDSKVKSHSRSHLQVDGINEIRLDTPYILYPFHFMDFIINNILPNEHKIILSTEDYKYLLNRSKKLIENDVQEEIDKSKLYCNLY